MVLSFYQMCIRDRRRMGRYDLCILSTHGAYYTYEYGWLFKKTCLLYTSRCV